MKDGIVQQVGGALEIYHHPANRFVASFLGSPPMNFFNGRLVDSGGRLCFDEGSAKLPVPAWALAALEPKKGESIVLGVRPESMSDPAHARFKTDSALDMRVTLVQPLGHRLDVSLATSAHPHSIAQIDAHAGLRVGETVPIQIDMAHVHFFDTSDAGERLAQNATLSASGAPL
jgi:multiple sugar transport system ATP-binding protein